MNKEKQIDEFLEKLKAQSITVAGDGEDIGDVLKEFAITCKKCGSHEVFVSWEWGCNYGGYTGYSEGQKLFKCNSCGNAASFYE